MPPPTQLFWILNLHHFYSRELKCKVGKIQAKPFVYATFVLPSSSPYCNNNIISIDLWILEFAPLFFKNTSSTWCWYGCIMFYLTKIYKSHFYSTKFDEIFCYRVVKIRGILHDSNNIWVVLQFGCSSLFDVFWSSSTNLIQNQFPIARVCTFDDSKILPRLICHQYFQLPNSLVIQNQREFSS